LIGIMGDRWTLTAGHPEGNSWEDKLGCYEIMPIINLILLGTI
jgi:hypothetical protein